jgi:ribonuclease HI
MELQAVIEALKKIHEISIRFPQDCVQIFVDSKYVYDGITSYVDKRLKNDWK